jgi:hypothetical protein
LSQARFGFAAGARPARFRNSFPSRRFTTHGRRIV